MATQTTEIRTVVNKLIQVCRDGDQGFSAAANALPADETLLKSELMQYSRQRREFASDMESELAQYGEEAVQHGTVSGALHRGWLSLKQGVSGNDRYAVLAECERGEDAAVSAYREAAGSGLPSPIAELIEMQHQAIKRVHDRIRALRDAAKAK
jgi:uncharacterized protein (TIGR02284 family)